MYVLAGLAAAGDNAGAISKSPTPIGIPIDIWGGLPWLTVMPAMRIVVSSPPVAAVPIPHPVGIPPIPVTRPVVPSIIAVIPTNTDITADNYTCTGNRCGINGRLPAFDGDGIASIDALGGNTSAKTAHQCQA